VAVLFRIIMFPNFCTFLRRIIQVNLITYRLKQSVKCREQLAARRTFKGHNSNTETIHLLDDNSRANFVFGSANW